METQVGVTDSRPRKGHIPFNERIVCSVPEAVAASSLSRGYLYRLMQAGKPEYRNAGRRRLVVVESLRKLVGLSA
jgi:hypothetical protein